VKTPHVRRFSCARCHRSVASSLSYLAECVSAQDNRAEAESLFNRSLAIREKTLGPNHPDVAASLESYAILLRKTNRASEATGMEERARVIKARTARLGSRSCPKLVR
jgi:tetratricopeptide repeat protein